MASKVLSIEMGDSLTKVCEVDYQTKNPKVYNSFVLETPKGVLEDGIITLNDRFINSMKNHLAEKKIKTKEVVFSITSTKIANREVNIPYVKESRIPDVVRANASDYFPIDLSQYQFAHNILGIETDDKASKQYKILVLAAPNILLDSYYSFAEALGLEIEALDYSGNSIYNAVKTECAVGTQMIIKVDENSSLLMVVKNGTIVLTRTIPYGINDAINTITLSDAWGSNLTYMEATDIARRKTLILRSLNGIVPETTVSEEEESEIILKAKQEVTSSLSYLIGGVSRVLDYYNSLNSNGMIERILLTGMGGDFSGLSKLLTNEIGSKVVTLTKLEGINIEKAFKEVSFGEYIGCIGAAINPLNFTKATTAAKSKNGKKESTRDYTYISLSVLILGLGISAALLMLSLMPYGTEKNQNEYLTDKIETLQPINAIYQSYLNSEASYNKMLALDNTTNNRLEELVSLINEMEGKMPSSFGVQSLSATTTGISMEVTVDTKAAAAKVISEFKTFESIDVVDVTSITEIESEVGEIQVSFSITVTYKPVVAEVTAE